MGHVAALLAVDIGNIGKDVGSRNSERGPADVAPGAGSVDLHTLYDAHWRYLVRLATLLVDDVASAEDVVQDAFVALHRKAADLRDPDAGLAYLRTSVLNLSRSVIRRRQVARKHLKVAEPEATAGADHDVLRPRRAPAGTRCRPLASPTPARGAGAAVLVGTVRT